MTAARKKKEKKKIGFFMSTSLAAFGGISIFGWIGPSFDGNSFLSLPQAFVKKNLSIRANRYIYL